jgi:hypothetical protein
VRIIHLAVPRLGIKRSKTISFGERKKKWNFFDVSNVSEYALLDASLPSQAFTECCQWRA